MLCGRRRATQLGEGVAGTPDIASLQGYEKRSSRRRLVFSRFPGVTGYTTYLAPPISRWDEDGFSSCSAYPCHRAAPTCEATRAGAIGAWCG